MRKLIDLRKKVKCIDQKIITLIYQRLTLTRKIGREKKKLGIPLQDWNVEKGVIENAMKCAEKIGMDSNFTRSLITSLIEQSRIQQEKFHYSTYSGSRENILVIGGLGAMGRWLAYFLQNQGHSVGICDIKQRGIKGFVYYTNLKDALTGKTVVFIATPLSLVPEIIDRLCESKCKAVVCDIASIKSHLIPAVKRAIKNGVKITSIHPMFGPSTHTLADKVVCLCDCGSNIANQKILNFFKDTAVKIINLSFDEHDRLVSYVLGLSHFINILFVNTLIKSGYDFGELNRISSTTFNSQLKTTLSVVQENPELYYEIQTLNPYNKNIFRNVNSSLDNLIKIVKKNQKNEFKRIFTNGSEWLNGY
ncbi:MAG: bifunctional chorismate mutase/prephenate dehydrogenase [candidate division WOR-3 bacterium]